MGIRLVNRLKVMQYRMVQGWCMCVNQHTLLSATTGAELITLYKCSIILSVLETILRPDHWPVGSPCHHCLGYIIMTYKYCGVILHVGPCHNKVLCHTLTEKEGKSPIP